MQTRSASIVFVAIAAVISGCGHQEKTIDTSVVVPNVIGAKADVAVHDVQKAGLIAILEPPPSDRTTCKVRSQNRTGKVPAHSTVVLTLICDVVVPDVTGRSVSAARNAIESAGDVVVIFAGGRPYSSDCTVKSQSRVGRVSAGARIRLDFGCPLTRDRLRAAAESLARKDQRGEPNEEFSIGTCDLVASDEGRCKVEYISASGTTCEGTIIVDLKNDDSTTTRQQVDCK